MGSEVVNSFALTSSTHGLVHTVGEKSAGSRTFWLVVLVVAVGGMLWLSTRILLQFFSGNQSSTISIGYWIPSFEEESVEGMEFPKVILCQRRSITWEYLSRLNISLPLANYIMLVNARLESEDKARFFRSQAKKHEDDYQKLLQRLPDGDILQLIFEAGGSCEGFFLRCSFNALPFDCCSGRFVRKVMDIDYGSCFLVHSLPNQRFPADGLTLTVKANTEKFIPNLSHTKGLAVRVQQEYDPLDGGEVRVSPLHSTAISLAPRQLRLTNGLFQTLCEPHSLYLNKKYCISLQSFQEMTRECGCTPPLESQLISSFPEYQITKATCSPKQKVDCTFKYLMMQGNEEWSSMNSCLPPCIRKYNSETVSNTLISEGDYNGTDETEIEIYFGNFKSQILTQSPSMSVTSLLANIGGAMGVFLGASVITLVECVVFAFRLLLSLCRKSTVE